jgi:hypothetical protein
MKSINRFLFPLVVFLGFAPTRSFANEDALFFQKARRVLKESAKLYDNQGVSLGLSGSGVAGAGISIDAVNFDGKVAFFCSSNASLKVENSVGFSSDISYISTRGCRVPGDYEGLFVSMTGYGGLAALGKVSVGGSVSYGFNFASLLDTLKSNFVNNPKNFLALLIEIQRVATCLQSDAGSKMIKFFLHVILKNLENLEKRVTDPILKSEISIEISRTKKILNNEFFISSCGFEKVSENLSKSKMQYLQYTLESIQDFKTYASFLPTKKQLALIVDQTIDAQNFPFLRQLLFSIFRNDMSGCDSLSAFYSQGIGGSVPLLGLPASLGVGIGLSHYKKIGPTLNVRELSENVIDRYVQNNGLKNLAIDLNGYARVCTAAGKCVWKAACMMTDREGFAYGVKKIKSVCSESVKNTVAFLNGMYECFKYNFEELTLRPYEILSKVGSEP